jgi:hypothetical protein
VSVKWGLSWGGPMGVGRKKENGDGRDEYVKVLYMQVWHK